jgi:hypothetical protein
MMSTKLNEHTAKMTIINPRFIRIRGYLKKKLIVSWGLGIESSTISFYSSGFAVDYSISVKLMRALVSSVAEANASISAWHSTPLNNIIFEIGSYALATF